MRFSVNNLESNFLIFLFTFVFIFIFRYFPHPPNFTPVLALTLYASMYFGLRSSPFVILAFALSDFFIGFHNVLIFTWGSLALISLVGIFGKSFYSRLSLLILSSIIFFVFTNFGVWLFSDFYTKDINGLFKCYVLAIPFFTNTIISTFVFGFLLEICIISKNKINPLIYK
tara:strand:+ start:911 stop:1423 length:513 start_codon:yes stop_codon:yes gene_type:complete